MVPATAVVRTGWLTDPVVDQVGPATVALVLHLAARAAEAAPAAGGAVVIAPDVWTAFIDAGAAARLKSAGLVEPIAGAGGGLHGVRVGAWLLGQIDTDQRINNRLRSRERMRRMRLRRAAGLPRQLPLWMDDRPAEGESTPALETKDLDANLCMCKNCGCTADVTSDVTETLAGALYPRARARPMVRTKYIPAASVRKAAKSTKQQKGPRPISDILGAEAPPAFRLVLALVARTRRARWSWRYPTTATDRRELLQAIRTDMVRARLAPPADRDIKRAIRIDECNDVGYRAAAGQIGGAR